MEKLPYIKLRGKRIIISFDLGWRFNIYFGKISISQTSVLF